MWQTRKSLASARPAGSVHVFYAAMLCFRFVRISILYFFAHPPKGSGRGGGPTGICAKDQSFIRYGCGWGESTSLHSLSLSFFHLSFSLTRAFAVFVCDGPNTSPVDTRQQYITRPTVQTGTPPRPTDTYPSQPYSHLHVTSAIPKELLPSSLTILPCCQIYDFRTFTVKISCGGYEQPTIRPIDFCTAINRRQSTVKIFSMFCFVVYIKYYPLYRYLNQLCDNFPWDHR